MSTPVDALDRSIAGAPAGRALLVDDNEATRYVLCTWLRRAGYVVEEAANGAEALAAIERGGQEIVVLDVNLPDIGGMDICEAIKADPATRSVPVLHVSATAVEAGSRTLGLVRGADAYLTEPLEREEFLATVGALLRYARARRRAEVLAERLAWLHATSLELNAASDAERLASIAAEAVSRLSGGAAAAAVVVDEGAVLAAASGTGPASVTALERGELAALAAEPAAVLDRLAPGLLSGARPLEVLTASVRPEAGASAVVVAETGGGDGEPVGDVLDQLAQVTGLAAENRLLYAREHAIAVTLQRSLLPPVPAIPWLDVAVRYVASTAQAEIGGDFYDVVALDEDRVALVIGDVQGHSLRAATIMATLRSSLAAYLLADRSPASALAMLNRILLRTHPDVVATVCCIVVHRDGRAVVANAGHPPPVVASGGPPRLLEIGGTLLGIDHPFEDVELRLEAGARLVLFTDGLVEGRKTVLGEGFARVVAGVAAAGDDVEDLCEALLDKVGPGRHAIDDIALVAARLRRAPGAS